jgi:hypothetical protein
MNTLGHGGRHRRLLRRPAEPGKIADPFEQGVGDKIIGHRAAVTEPKRQQDLVAPE